MNEGGIFSVEILDSASSPRQGEQPKVSEIVVESGNEARNIGAGDGDVVRLDVDAVAAIHCGNGTGR